MKELKSLVSFYLAKGYHLPYHLLATSVPHDAQKIKFSMKGSFSRCDQIRRNPLWKTSFFVQSNRCFLFPSTSRTFSKRRQYFYDLYLMLTSIEWFQLLITKI